MLFLQAKLQNIGIPMKNNLREIIAFFLYFVQLGFLVEVTEQQSNRLFINGLDCYNITQMSATGFNTSFGVQGYANLGSSLSSERKAQNQYKKIFCAYHATEFLTNFCTDKSCLMPLCPTCVVQHTEQHYQRNQKPSYVNLHDALHDSRQQCYSAIVKLEDYGRRNAQLNNYITGLPDYIRKQLGECKQKLFQMIQESFEQYETKLIDDIRTKYAEEGVYSRKECEEVREYINKEIEELYQKITQLKGDQCLAALIRYYENDQKNLESELSEITEYIDRNRKAGGLYISLNNDQTNRTLQGFCQKIVALEYVQQEESKSYNSHNYEGLNNSKKFGNSAVKRVGSSGVKGSSSTKKQKEI